MFWCNDPNSIYYNKLKKRSEGFTSERVFRSDQKYDYLIPISYNRKKILKNKGSAIFIHLTKDYKPTAGCIALKITDFKIMLKIIKKNTFIKIS